MDLNFSVTSTAWDTVYKRTDMKLTLGIYMIDTLSLYTVSQKCH